MIRYERLATPAENLGVLVEPPPREMRAALSGDYRATLSRAKLLDTTIGELRDGLRRRLSLAEDRPLIVTGHQAEFFHAGVFAKSLATNEVACASGGNAVFLTVDSDIPKTAHVHVPHVAGHELNRESIAIPGLDPALPMQWQPRVAAGRWRSFFDELRGRAALPADSLLDAFADAWLSGQSNAVDLCDAFVRGNQAAERMLSGAASRDVRTSQLCATLEFRALVAHIALEALRFVEEYNAAQVAYRARHHVRNEQRPAPLLAVERDRIELPFWIMRTGGRRQRLFVMESHTKIELFADEEPAGTLDRRNAASAAWHASPWELEAAGWHIRPRALLLSGFVRLFLADLFIHGIGGAKYDEMTADFIQRFFGVGAPPIACVTATLHLAALRDVGGSQAASGASLPADFPRQLQHNPQRWLTGVAEPLLARRAELIDQSRHLREAHRSDHAARRQAQLAIREVNRQMVDEFPAQVAELTRRWTDSLERQKQRRIARDREYFYALHSRSDLEALAAAVPIAIGA